MSDTIKILGGRHMLEARIEDLRRAWERLENEKWAPPIPVTIWLRDFCERQGSHRVARAFLKSDGMRLYGRFDAMPPISKQRLAMARL